MSSGSAPRAAVLVALVLTLGTLAPFAEAAHPEGGDRPLGHINLDVRDLGPGERFVHHLESPEGPLRAGWIYIMYGGVQGDGHIVVNLTQGDTLTDRFVWTGGAFHHNSTKIQRTGDHNLTLWNPTNVTLRYAFYYDQSCNCAGKVIPVQGGFVLFNHDFQAGREVNHALFVYDEAITLNARLATYDKTQETAHWPEDFEILDEKTVSGRDWLNFTFTPPVTQTYFVFYEAVRGGTPEDPVTLTPLIDVAREDQAAPGPFALLLLALVALAGASRPRAA